MTKSTTFEQGQTSSIGNFIGYAWSDANNWTNGIPVDGDNVVFNQGTTSNPDGYVDIGNLYLDNLTLTQGFLSVTDTLQIGALVFSADYGEIGTDTLPGTGPALLTIDSFANANRGYVEAIGTGAVTNVLATTDPGEVYLADDGGEVELTAAPSTNSTLQFSASTSPATFALRNASGTISAVLYDADVGKSLALPGTSVSNVVFGSHSIVITTNLGTITFSDVFYAPGAEPTGYTVSADPTGLQRITFTDAKSTTFEQGQTGSVGNFTGYAWSDANNWTNGIPVDGDTVVFNQGTTSNPDGYVDIDNLYLDNLTLTQGFISVVDTLGIGEIAFSADYGEIGADTYPGNSTALLTIDGFANANRGYIAADGTGAVVNVLATTDPGEVYLADGGGEVEITAAPNTNSTLQFSASTLATTFALRNASGTISAVLYDADVGKSLALPGTSVSNVVFGSHSIVITTNLGTITFSDVFYAPGAEPTGYTVSADPTGLQRITFTDAKSTTFEQGQTGSVGNFTGYAWSDANNWTNGIPVDGDNVVFNQGTTSNPDGYVDIGNLYLDNLTMTQGFLSVVDTLGIGDLAFSADFGEIDATTYPGNSTALLTIDGFANANRGYIAADGAGAVVNVLATTDPGEVYLADGGGEVEITAAPNTNSTLQFSSSYTPATFALFNPGSIVSADLYDADVGKSVALPGSSVSAVTFGSHSIAITTNLGTTTFSSVFYGGAEPTGYTASADPSGLERITFDGLACFAAGTRILCIDGDTPVEDIAVGDRLVTVREGGPVSRRVVWTGRRAIDIARHPRPETVRPVRIIAGAFGHNVPERDLRLSPLHAVYIDGGLFEAISLVNGTTIYQEHATRHVTYHHIELEAHDVVLAEGLPAESFLDTGDRTMFEAESGVVALHPDFATPDGAAFCAPMIRDGERLCQVRAELDARIRQRA